MKTAKQIVDDIDYKDLVRQKEIVVEMAQDWRYSSDPKLIEKANFVEGLVNLTDELQDYIENNLNE